MLKLLVTLGFIAAVANACTDNNQSCPSWARSSQNYCRTNTYVKSNCKKSCGTCSGGGSGSCVDTGKYCSPGYETNCSKDWFKKECPKFCKACSGGGSGGSGGNGGGSGSSGKCGISKVSQSRVVNGQEAQPGAWPWIVSLQTSRGFHFCGGSILTPNWILTASHCVRGKSSLNVIAGAHDKSQSESTQQKISSKRIVMHPNYASGSLNYDVALVQLSRPLQLNDRVVKACLPQQGVYPQIGKNCYVAGWGRVSVSPSRSPNKLQQARLPILEQRKCGDHFVCTGYGYGSQGRPHPNICQGDSGGPLMCQRSDGSWQLEGAASWVLKDCTIYSAYAALHKYLGFVKQHVHDL